MNDVQLLTEQLEREPNNSIVASMLVDELQTARGMTYSEAFRHVANVMAVAEEAHALTKATKLMLPGTATERFLYHAVKALTDSAYHQVSSVLVVSGDAQPCAFGPAPWDNDTRIWRITATVGAGWILKTWEKEQMRRADARTARRNRRLGT